MTSQPTTAGYEVGRSAAAARAGEPAGWLRDQLQIQADGLTGHLDEFWPDVARSQWIGGDAEGWERGPYWLDGLVPLAVLLDDARADRPKADAGSTRSWPPARRTAGSGPIHDTRSATRTIRGRSSSCSRRSPSTRRRPATPASSRAMTRLLRKLDAVLAEQPAALVGALPLGRPAAQHPLALRADAARRWLLDLARQGAGAGLRLARPLRRASRTGTRSTASSATSRHPRRQRGDGAQGARRLVAPVRRPGRPRAAAPDARRARPVPRPGDRHVLLRRAPGRPEPVAGQRAMRRRRGDVLAGGAARDPRRAGAGRPAGAARLQRPAGHAYARYVGAPVRPAGQPGGLPGVGRARLDQQRPGVERLRARAELWLLHGQPAPGLAEVCGAPLDALARTTAWQPWRTARASSGRGARRRRDGRRRDRVPVRRRDPGDGRTAPARSGSRSGCGCRRWADGARIRAQRTD